MEIFVRDIPLEGLELAYDADPFQLELVGEGVGFEGLIHAELSVSKQQDLVFVTGRTTARMVLECGRCLKKFSLPMDLGIHVEYIPSVTGGGNGQEHELKSEDLDVIFFTGETIDLDALIRDQVILAVPMRPICLPTCRGLCPRCGQDLNMATCSCATSEPDARFSILKNYIK